MNRSIRDLLLFLTPLILLLGFPVLVFYRTGEFEALNVGGVVERQMTAGAETYFGPGYTNCAYAYKLQGVLRHRPAVLLLGSSRVMQYRTQFFNSKNVFNGGGAVAKISHLKQFLARIPEGQEPKVVLLALDPEWFNAEWDRSQPQDYEERLRGCITGLALIQGSHTQIYKDVNRKKITFASIVSPPERAIGLSAIMHQEGFRNDGSYRYGKRLGDPEDVEHYDREFRDTFSRIDSGTRRFEPGDSPSSELVAGLEAFLAEAKRRGIHVVSPLAPYAPSVWGRLQLTGKHGYLNELGSVLSPIYAAHGAAFFNFIDPASVGGADNEFIDGFHGSERIALRMLRAMAQQDAVLGAEVSTAQLDAAEKQGTPLVVLPN